MTLELKMKFNEEGEARAYYCGMFGEFGKTFYFEYLKGSKDTMQMRKILAEEYDEMMKTWMKFEGVVL